MTSIELPLARGPVAKVQPSATGAFGAMVKAKVVAGEDIIDMTEGEPDFQPPSHVLNAARDGIRLGITKYTPTEGSEELRSAIRGKFRRENGLDYDTEQILVTTGAKQALYNALRCLVTEGDEVIVLSPYWVSYPAQVVLAGGTPVFVKSVDCNGYIPDPDAIEGAITSRTTAVVVNSPCNPTGCIYPPDVIDAIAQLANKHGIWIISDEIYEHLVFDGTFHSAAKKAVDRTLIVNGASKTLALTGWRIGYAAGPRKLIAAMARLQSHTTSGANALAQFAVTAALTAVDQTEAFVHMAVSTYRERRDALVEGLNRIGLPTKMPAGAFYALADTGSIDADERVAARYLLQEAGVAVVPGTDFGAPGTVRFCYSVEIEHVREAIARIEQVVR